MKSVHPTFGRSAVIAGTVTALFVGHAVLARPENASPGLARDGLIAAAALWHGTIYVGVGLLFGLSLRPGREALVSRLARRVEPCPTTALQAYTRRVTWAWTAFAAAQLALSALLLATAPLTVWSIFVNVLHVPLVALMFVAEYAVRRWRFRNLRMASLAATIGVFLRRHAVEGERGR